MTTAYAHRERLALVALLREVGPDAPTVCDGWTTSDLVAHLIARERRPDSGPGLLLRPLAGYTEHVRQGYRDRDYAELLDQLADPPWWSPLANPLADELANTMEMFLHHEDVRRCRPGWEPRELSTGQQRQLWRRLNLVAALRMRSLPTRVSMVAPGFGERSVGSGPKVCLSGPPGELLLFVSGRQRVARLDADGPPETVEAMFEANLAM